MKWWNKELECSLWFSFLQTTKWPSLVQYNSPNHPVSGKMYQFLLFPEMGWFLFLVKGHGGIIVQYQDSWFRPSTAPTFPKAEFGIWFMVGCVERKERKFFLSFVAKFCLFSLLHFLSFPTQILEPKTSQRPFSDNKYAHLTNCCSFAYLLHSLKL